MADESSEKPRPALLQPKGKPGPKTPEGMARAIANLKPYVKGQPSANPGGRPKGVASRLRELTNNGEDIYARLVALAKGEISMKREEVEANRIILERMLGKAPEVVLTGELDSEAKNAVSDLTADQLTDIVAGLKGETADPPAETPEEQPN